MKRNMEAQTTHLTRPEYDRLRSLFLDFAKANGWQAGSNEFGYHDDDHAASAEWKQWFAYATAKKNILGIVPPKLWHNQINRPQHEALHGRSGETLRARTLQELRSLTS